MLKIHQISSPDHKWELLKSFDPSRDTWLVSDLKSKFLIQDHIHIKMGFVEDDSILRTRELWERLLRRAAPEYSLVSMDYIKSFLDNILKQSQFVEFENQTVRPDSLFILIDELLPVLAVHDSEDIITEWIESQGQKQLTWQKWIFLAFRAWEMLQNKKIIPSQWAMAILYKEMNFKQLWKRNIWLDLGPELQPMEAELIHTLSQVVDVHVVEPCPQFDTEIYHIKQAYQLLYAHTSSNQIIRHNQEPRESSDKKVIVGRYTTMLAEVKQATAQVRKWLDLGVEATEIAIIASDIEIYWPCLSAFLLKEGIQANKDEVVKLQSRNQVMRWRARLRNYASSMSTADLELGVFAEDKKPPLAYTEFLRLFSALYDIDDLQRHSAINNIYQKKLSLTQVFMRDEFLLWSIGLWDFEKGSQDLESIVRELIYDIPFDEKMSLKIWLQYLDGIMARREVPIQKANPNGISVINMLSAATGGYSYRIFLGLSEEQLKTPSYSVLYVPDIEKMLDRDLGFRFRHPEKKSLEFEFLWATLESTKEDHFYFAESDFSGNPLGPSLGWLRLCDQLKRPFHDKSSAEVCRWDELMLHSDQFADLESLSLTEREAMKKRLKQDFAEEESDRLTLIEKPSLSPRTVESYLSCPFIFAAEKLFGLMDPEVVDLELGHLSKGQAHHKLLEYLTEEPLKWDWTDVELQELIEKVVAETQLVFTDEHFARFSKKRMMDLARRFLAFEKNWRDLYKHTKTVAREQSFQFELEDFTIRGKIDRIDSNSNVVGSAEGESVQDGDQLAIIDYKESLYKKSNATSWIKNNEIQLAVYAYAIHKGFVAALGDRQVVAAHYYALKDMSRNKGLNPLDADSGFLPRPSSHGKRHAFDTDARERLLLETEEKLKQVIERVKNGEISAKPFDKRECENCRWSKMCRAPHLST